MRPGEGIRSAGEVLSELQRQVERHASGKVRRAVRPTQPPSKVHPIHVERSAAVPARNCRVEHQRAGYRAARTARTEGGVEVGGGSFQVCLEARVDRDVFQAVQHACPFLEREPGRADVKVELGRRGVVVGPSSQRERRPRRFHEEIVERPSTGSATEAAFQSRRSGRAPGRSMPHSRTSGATSPARSRTRARR